MSEYNAESDPEVNCYFEQKVPGNPEDGDIQPLKADGYGFAFKQTGVFSRLLGECQVQCYCSVKIWRINFT